MITLKTFRDTGKTVRETKAILDQLGFTIKSEKNHGKLLIGTYDGNPSILSQLKGVEEIQDLLKAI